MHIKKIVPLKPCLFGLNRIVTVPGKPNYAGSFRNVREKRLKHHFATTAYFTVALLRFYNEGVFKYDYVLYT